MIDDVTDYYRGYRIYRVSDGWRYEHVDLDWYDAADGRHGFAETHRAACAEIDWRSDDDIRDRLLSHMLREWWLVVGLSILVIGELAILATIFLGG